MPTPKKDFMQTPVTLATGTWTEVLAAQACISAEISQLPSETAQVIKVRHRTATDTDHEEIQLNGVLKKGDYKARASPGLKTIRVGEILGYFQASTGTPIIQIKLFEA